MRFDPVADHARLAELQLLIERWIELHSPSLGTSAPAVSGWSAEQHLAHVALANELVVRNLKSLLRGAGALVIEGGEPIAGTLEMLERGVLPRGRAQSPRMVRPPETIERALLCEWLADARRELAALDPRTLVASGKRIPHQILGALDAPQWLRFGVVHSAHHLAIAREVLIAVDAGLERALELPAFTDPRARPLRS